MELFSKRYVIKFRNGRRKRKTAQEILELVKRDCRSNYNWFASSSELVRICKLKDFPKDIATLIEAAILNCYANIENSVRIYSGYNSDVAYCYNSLIENQEYDSLREKYICAVLRCVINYGLKNEPCLFSIGKTHEQMLLEWQYKIANEFVSSRERIPNLNILYQIFSEKFYRRMICVAHENGLFDKDEQESFNSSPNNIPSWEKVLKMNDYYPDPDQIR